MVRRVLKNALSTFWVALCWLVAFPAAAGNNGFFVTYNSRVEKGELELMVMNDYTQPSTARRAEGQGDYFSQMIELEYGVTDQYATELMIEWFADTESGQKKFTGFRWENRYRLFRDDLPLNPMVYVEYEDLDPATRFKMEVSGWVRPPYHESEEEPDRERILESRLILSDDIGPVNVAFNWISETDLGGGTTAFGYSIGAMWMPGHGGRGSETAADEFICPMHPEQKGRQGGLCPKCGMSLASRTGESGSMKSGACTCARDMSGCRCAHCAGGAAKCPCGHAGMVGLGIELYGALGDTKAFGLSASRQEHYLGPILVYHISSQWMVHTQLAIGLTKASDNLVRLNLGFEF